MYSETEFYCHRSSFYWRMIRDSFLLHTFHILFMIGSLVIVQICTCEYLKAKEASVRVCGLMLISQMSDNALARHELRATFPTLIGARTF